MPTNKTIYLIRHGQTDYNKLGIVQGSGIDSDLNELGKWQANQFYSTYKSVKFGHIFTSELKRTYQSVVQFISPTTQHQVLSGLNEISWGKYEGLKSTPKEHAVFINAVNQWAKGDLDLALDGGESPNTVQKRQINALEQILDSESENILVCMHGRALKIMISLMLDTPLKDMDQYTHSNLCLYKIGYKSNKIILIDKNNTLHLKA